MKYEPYCLSYMYAWKIMRIDVLICEVKFVHVYECVQESELYVWCMKSDFDMHVEWCDYSMIMKSELGLCLDQSDQWILKWFMNSDNCNEQCMYDKWNCVAYNLKKEL